MSVSRPSPEEARDYQGHYAGPVTRLLAYSLDLLFISVSFTLMAGLITLAIETVTPWSPKLQDQGWLAAAIYFGWSTFYLGGSWIGFARTPAMSVFGLRICRADGSTLDGRHAFIRLLAFPLGFLTLGAGFLGIIFSRTHQAIYDRIADTAVVYDWDAESTRLRALVQRR